ncbi:MAG: SpoIIE family protein phosphatase, partial [Bacteroidales bacterium]|nr:SpoIIE family protein phosphatase [Bacteroidales bacterium]
YSNSHKNRFAYQLVGYEDKWRHVGATQRFAHFNNLDPKEYKFLVRSSNSDGVWNETPVSLQIKVYPPWWETLWFKVVSVVFIVMCGVAFYFYRVNNLRQQKRKLEKKVYERTIELESANVELTEQKEEILAQKEEIEQQADELVIKSASLEEQFKITSHQKEEISNSLNRLEILSEFGQKLTSSLNIEVINDMFYKYACNILTIDAFGVGLYHEEEKAIVYPYFYENGVKQDIIVKQLKDKRSLSSWCFINQQPVVINDIFNEYGKYVTELNHPETTKITQSRIHIPLTVEDKRIGLLVINAFPKNAYGDEDFKSIQTLASYISIALDNANAYKIIHKDRIRITESIDAAQNIQQAFLPGIDFINQYIESFVLFKPKDIVSGDFYWFLPIEEDSNKPKDFFIAAVDCTGHGVPGAFISLIGNSLLNELIKTMRIHNPAEVLTELNKRLKAWLKQEEGVNNDGMDIALCRVQETKDGYNIRYAGARRALTFIKFNTKKGEVIAGSRYSIGGIRAIKRNPKFELKEIKLDKGDCIYLFTDGYTDQNSPDRTKFSIANLRDLLGRIANKPMLTQQNILEEVLKDFQKREKQRDDITVIGMRL